MGTNDQPYYGALGKGLTFKVTQPQEPDERVGTLSSSGPLFIPLIHRIAENGPHRKLSFREHSF
jgi:hypothetical protein